MKISTILILIVAGQILISCGTSNKFHASFSEDKPLYSAINRLVKKPDDKKAQNDLKVLYDLAVERHMDAIDAYRGTQDIRKWDKILAELNALQGMYTGIYSTPGAVQLLKPVSYIADIEEVKTLAAEAFYQEAEKHLSSPGRDNSRLAYNAFKKANNYIAHYKDTDERLKEAYERSVVNVVINPVEEDIAMHNFSNWNTSFQYRPEEFQQSLVRDLDARSAIYMAKFFTERDARRNDITPDWIVDIGWRNIDVLNSIPQKFSRQVSKSIQVGTDTSGKAITKTVYATLNVTQRVFNVRGNLDFRIRDIEEDELVDNGYIMDDVSWTDSYASYTGDARALSDEDRYLINRTRTFTSPSRGEIMNALMLKSYPELKRRIEHSLQ